MLAGPTSVPSTGAVGRSGTAWMLRFRIPVAAVAVTVALGGCGKTRAVGGGPPPPDPGVYVSPAGASDGDGSREHPLDLQRALSATSPVRPGGTVWLMGGIYRLAAPIVSELRGTAAAPITVRSAAGEHAVLDGADVRGPLFTANGAWTTYRDFELMSSASWRSGAQLDRASGVDVHGVHLTLANLVVHDLGTGFGIWADAEDTEAYGNIVYYNGWVGPDRPHGHGIYTQNKAGIRRLTDNVVFSQFGIGIHAYGSDEAFLDDMTLEGNVVFSNGVTAADLNILVGGHRVANRPVLRANMTYVNPGPGNNLGFDSGCTDARVTDNYFVTVRGGYSMELRNCTGVVDRNVFIGATRGITGKHIQPQDELKATYPGNEFAERSAASRVFVRPNRFTPGRAHVVVFNWEGASDVDVDLAPAAIPIGAMFTIRDVRNLGGPPVVSAVYSGRPVRLPLNGLTSAPIIGWPHPVRHEGPEFAAFLVTREGEQAPSALAQAMAWMRGWLPV